MRSQLAQLVTERACSLARATGAMLECFTPTESICVVAVGSLVQLDNSRYPLERSLAAACAGATAPLVCNATEADARLDAALCREFGAHSLLAVVARSSPDEQVVLSVVNGAVRFEERDVRTLQVLMDLLAAAVIDVRDAPARATLTALGESAYQQVLDAITDMVLVKGPHSRIVWGNKAFRDAYGMTNEQLRGIIDSAASPADHTQKYVQDDKQVFETGKTLDIPDEPVTRHDGTVRSYNTVKSAIVDATGRVSMTVGVSRDMTDRKLLEIELRNAQKLEAIGRLASGIAHEINTPIQFIGDNTSFLRSGFEALLDLYARARVLCERARAAPLEAVDWNALLRAEGEADLAFLQAECSKAFDSTLHGIAHVTRVVVAMKVFAHADQHEKEAVDLNQLLAATLTIAAHQIKHVADVETEFGEVPLVPGYPSELNQVFLNLLVNAAHAIADFVSTGAPRGRICVRSFCDRNEVVASISDTGGGIPLEIQSRVFEPFFTTKEIGRGTGQGLALARAIIVDKHHGRIAFDTSPGAGTTFRVYLPMAAAPSA